MSLAIGGTLVKVLSDAASTKDHIRCHNFSTKGRMALKVGADSLIDSSYRLEGFDAGTKPPAYDVVPREGFSD